MLIVDDTPENIHVLMETLRESYKIVAATSGAKALQLAVKEPLPDLILLDVMMPGIDGYQVCEELKNDPRTEQIPVIFVTALNEAGDEERGLELGAVDFITKPFHPGLVKARVRNQLELKRHRDHLETEVQRRTQELLTANAARQKLENELDVARRLQHSMLHSGQLQIPESGAALAAILRPARAVGGDLYDYSQGKEGKLLFTIGDVSDKGVAAALFMVRVLTLLRSLAPNSQSPATLLAEVNEALCQDNDALMFVTLCCCEIDLATNRFSLASGGHEPPILLGAETARFLTEESGPALGLLPEAEFPLSTGTLAPGQTLLLYTDGITEAEDQGQSPFGEEHLLEICSEVSQFSPQDLLQAIIDQVGKHVSHAEQSDDLTLLAFQAGGGEK